MSKYYQSKNEQLKMQKDRISEQKDTGMPFCLLAVNSFLQACKTLVT